MTINDRDRSVVWESDRIEGEATTEHFQEEIPGKVCASSLSLSYNLETDSATALMTMKGMFTPVVVTKGRVTITEH